MQKQKQTEAPCGWKWTVGSWRAKGGTESRAALEPRESLAGDGPGSMAGRAYSEAERGGAELNVPATGRDDPST